MRRGPPSCPAIAVADGVAALAYVAGHPRGAATRVLQRWRNVTAWMAGTSLAMTLERILSFDRFGRGRAAPVTAPHGQVFIVQIHVVVVINDRNAKKFLSYVEQFDEKAVTQQRFNETGRCIGWIASKATDEQVAMRMPIETLKAERDVAVIVDMRQES